MKTAKDRIEQIKRWGYPLDFGTTFNHAFEIYKKIAAPAGLAFLIFGVLISMLVMGYVFTSLDWQRMAQNPEQFNLAHFSTVGLVSYAVAMILFTAITVPLSAGLIKMCYDAEKGHEVNFGSAFSYFSGPYFVDLFLAGLLIGTVNIGLGIAFELLGVGFVGSILSLIIGVGTLLFVPLIIFGNLRPIESIVGSFAVVSRNFFLILGLMIVGWIISFCGIIACCVGIFFTMPIVYALNYSIYVHSVGIDENEETSELS
jgi:hypothetical protein